MVMRFTRVVFGVSLSPFLLNGTIHHHMKQYESMDAPFVQKFTRSIYVDDVTFGADDEESMYELFVKAKNKLSDGGFNVSSSSMVQGRIYHQEQLQSRLTTLDQHITEEDE